MKQASTASFRYVRIAPTKLRGLVNLVRGKQVEKALDLLRFSPQRGATSVLKLVKSAVANADSRGGVDVDRLYIGSIKVDEGPRWKRHRPRSKGMANGIIKRTSHVSIELVER